jgi:hypothetical protein
MSVSPKCRLGTRQNRRPERQTNSAKRSADRHKCVRSLRALRPTVAIDATTERSLVDQLVAQAR